MSRGNRNCPVCRYCTDGGPADSSCQECGSNTSLWICLICGFMGCGRCASLAHSRALVYPLTCWLQLRQCTCKDALRGHEACLCSRPRVSTSDILSSLQTLLILLATMQWLHIMYKPNPTSDIPNLLLFLSLPVTPSTEFDTPTVRQRRLIPLTPFAGLGLRRRRVRP